MTAQSDHACRKRSIVIAGHRTSVSLEQPFWDALCDLARLRGQSANQLVGDIDRMWAAEPSRPNLSSACRLVVLQHLRANARGALLGAAT